MIAPGPLFFAGGDMMIGHMHDAGLGGMIVAAKKILLCAHAHIRTGGGNIGVPGKIVGTVIDRPLASAVRRQKMGWTLLGRHASAPALAVIDAIISALALGIFAGGALGVVRHIITVGRKKRLISFVNARSHVGPPKKTLRQRRPVIGAHLQLDDRAIGMQAYPVHPLHSAKGVVVAQPYRLGAVRVFFNFKLSRQKRGGTMMLRPVEFNAAGNPWACQTDQGGLNDRLAIDKVVTVGFVMGDTIGKRQRINFSAAALINPSFQKHGIQVRGSRQVSRYRHCLSPDPDTRTFTHNLELLGICLQVSPFIATQGGNGNGLNTYLMDYSLA